MKKIITFYPSFLKLDKISNFTIKEINEECMYLQSSPGFISKKSSPITFGIVKQILSLDVYKETIKKFPTLNTVIDTRINNLVPGIWPSIPGWHCDDVYRPDKDSQPDIFLKDSFPSFHFMVLVGSKDSISNTEFLTNSEPVVILDPASVWRSVNSYIESNRKYFSFSRCPGNQIVFFNNQALHRAMPATSYGIRLFFRLSLTYREPVNIIRNTVTNYADIEKAGW